MLKKLYRSIRLLPKIRKEPYVSFRKILHFYPYNITLYKQALVHKSSSIRMKGGRWINNERLEFLGDAILDAIVADIVYKEFEFKKEGFLTTMRSKIVQRETLNRLALELGIDKLITTSARSNMPHTHMYGNALEALIGAIYLDQGYRVAKRFVSERLIKPYMDIEDVAESEQNHKSRLIEWSQKNKIALTFELLENSIDKNNVPKFRSAVVIHGELVSEGFGYSKKESHQDAASKALGKLHNDSVLRTRITSILEQNAENTNQSLAEKLQ